MWLISTNQLSMLSDVGSAIQKTQERGDAEARWRG